MQSSTQEIPRIAGAPEAYVELRVAQLDLSAAGKMAVGLNHVANLITQSARAFYREDTLKLAIQPLETAIANLIAMRDDVVSQKGGKFPHSYLTILDRSLAIAQCKQDAEPIRAEHVAADLEVIAERFREQALEQSSIELIFGTHWRAAAVKE